MVPPPWAAGAEPAGAAGTRGWTAGFCARGAAEETSSRSSRAGIRMLVLWAGRRGAGGCAFGLRLRLTALPVAELTRCAGWHDHHFFRQEGAALQRARSADIIAHLDVREGDVFRIVAAALAEGGVLIDDDRLAHLVGALDGEHQVMDGGHLADRPCLAELGAHLPHASGLLGAQDRDENRPD